MILKQTLVVTGAPFLSKTIKQRESSQPTGDFWGDFSVESYCGPHRLHILVPLSLSSFILKSYLIRQWVAGQRSVLGGPRRVERRSTNANRRAEDATLSHMTIRMTSCLHVPIPAVCYCYQAIHSGGQKYMSKSHLLHHMYSTVTVERIDTP